jgi:MFS family permease
MNEKHWTSWLAHAFAIISLGCIATSLWLPADPSTAGDGAWDDWADVGFLVQLLVTLFVGWFLSWRRPRTALGWLIVAIPFLFTFGAPLTLLGHPLISTHPTAATWLLLFGGGNSEGVFWVPPVGLLLSQIPLRFPTGSLPSRRWRWFFWYTVAAIVTATALGSTTATQVGYGVANPVHIAWGDAEPIVYVIVLGCCLLPSIVGSVASLFVRYRRAGTVEKAQLRWVFWAAAMASWPLVLSWIVFLLVGDFAWIERFSALVLLGYGLIPVAILVAVMRFGLYGIDRIISRTVSYTIVVLVVAMLYAGIVVGLSSLIPNLPSVGVALATLAAATVFLPLLRWVRLRIDRYFNRAAYDAQQVVEAFGQRLRDGADPHTASADLLAAIDQTLQPSTLGVWTR